MWEFEMVLFSRALSLIIAEVAMDRNEWKYRYCVPHRVLEGFWAWGVKAGTHFFTKH